MSTNLETLTNDLEKENPLTAEALGSTLLNKENLELKTEIPFNDEVWNTALMKSVGDLIELDFLELRDVIRVTDVPKTTTGDIQVLEKASVYANGNVLDDFRITVKVKVDLPDGTSKDVSIPLARYLGELYKRQIKYSEEYAVSHNRKGRLEVAGMVGRKMEEKQQQRQPDMLGRMNER